MPSGRSAPREFFATLMSNEVLQAPGTATQVGVRDGVQVVAGYGIQGDGDVGIFNIATSPEFRGRGYARLLTEQIMRDGFAVARTR